MNKTSLILTASLIAGLLAACGGSAPLPTATEPPAPTEAIPSPTASPIPTVEVVPATEVPATDSPAATTSGFASSVYPIFEAKCIKCHGVEQVKEGLSMLSYDELMAGSFNGPVVLPGNADGSLLVDLIARGKMPNRGPKVTEGELQIIKDWINQGALNN
ncbi:MAG: hypothetical protein HS100_19060 [Anaerolineales bacterium]|nr:hypothetical protein [Anaerolineales bacterium]